MKESKSISKMLEKPTFELSWTHDKRAGEWWKFKIDP